QTRQEGHGGTAGPLPRAGHRSRPHRAVPLRPEVDAVTVRARQRHRAERPFARAALGAAAVLPADQPGVWRRRRRALPAGSRRRVPSRTRALAAGLLRRPAVTARPHGYGPSGLRAGRVRSGRRFLEPNTLPSPFVPFLGYRLRGGPFPRLRGRDFSAGHGFPRCGGGAAFRKNRAGVPSTRATDEEAPRPEGAVTRDDGSPRTIVWPAATSRFPSSPG